MCVHVREEGVCFFLCPNAITTTNTLLSLMSLSPPDSLPSCQGPCLPRCWKCPLHVTLMAYVAMAHILASMAYLLLTQHLGSPLRDSLTPAQVRIKRDAMRARSKAYSVGLGGACLLLALWRPFRTTASR